jgi:hypothetical protein
MADRRTPLARYHQAYRDDVDAAMRLYAGTDVAVYWASSPVPRRHADDPTWPTLNELYAGLPDRHPEAHFVDAGTAVLRDGRYTDVLPCLADEPCAGIPDPVTGEPANPVRSPDGGHFCPAAVGDADGRIPGCPVWSSGAWRFGRALAAPVAADLGRVTVAGAPGAWVVSADGRVVALGMAPRLGDLADQALTGAVVAAAATPTGRGYWLATEDGAVQAFGDAREHGSMAGAALNAPIVGLAATPTGHGYWLLAADGGIFSFGDATFHGSTGAIRLNRPVVDLAATPTGRGYWLVADDGGVFAFGDATFHGSTGGLRLNSPVRSLAATADGYRMVARDGGIFSFDAPFHGSLPDRPSATGEGVRIRSTADGYYLLTADGAVHGFGPITDLGSAGTDLGSASGELTAPAVDLVLL